MTNRGKFAPDTTVVNETNEWYSHEPTAAAAATASTAAVPGVHYLSNVTDTGLPTYKETKSLIGFDNQPTGAKSRLCSGDLSVTIAASGFVPLNAGITAPTASDSSGANCREFPGQSYPGYGGAKHYVVSAWVAPTG